MPTEPGTLSACEKIRKLIFRVCEQEATPDEALRVGRHLPDCTSCRILVAREYRLAEMLERDLEDLPVGEEFVESVMTNLPSGPPPCPTLSEKARRRQRWRGLKLASFAGLLGLIWLPELSPLRVAALPNIVGSGGLPSSLGAANPDAVLPSLFGVAGWVLMTLDSLGSNLTTYLPSLRPPAIAIGLVIVPLGLAFLGASAILGGTALARRRFGSS